MDKGWVAKRTVYNVHNLVKICTSQEDTTKPSNTRNYNPEKKLKVVERETRNRRFFIPHFFFLFVVVAQTVLGFDLFVWDGQSNVEQGNNTILWFWDGSSSPFVIAEITSMSGLFLNNARNIFMSMDPFFFCFQSKFWFPFVAHIKKRCIYSKENMSLSSWWCPVYYIVAPCFCVSEWDGPLCSTNLVVVYFVLV